MNILGISAFYHDSAACIIKDGELIAATQEERFTRKKHDHSFPLNSIQYCLEAAKINRLDLEKSTLLDYGNNARTYVEKNYSNEILMKKLESIYKAVTKSEYSD